MTETAPWPWAIVDEAYQIRLDLLLRMLTRTAAGRDVRSACRHSRMTRGGGGAVPRRCHWRGYPTETSSKRTPS